MARGQEETSTSGRPGGCTWATPSASSIISSLMMDELMAYREVPDNIDLQLMERTDESTLGGEHNGVFFTREHLAAGLRFPVPALVKQFLHFTWAPVDPHFSLASPLYGRDSLFVFEKPFKKRFGVATYFCFILKGKNKIRKKNPKYDS